MLIDTTTNNRKEIELFYNSLEQADSDFLKAKEYEIVKIGNSYLTDLGKIFKEAQDRLSKNGYGTFGKWIEVLGANSDNVYRWINRYNLIVANCENQNAVDLIESLPKSLSYEISKPSAHKELVEQVMNGDITTHKAYKELEQRLKEKEETERLQTNRINSLFRDKEELNSQLELLKKSPKEKEYIEVESPELQKSLFEKEQELGRVKLKSQEMLRDIENLKTKLKNLELPIKEKEQLENNITLLKKQQYELKQHAERYSIEMNAIQELSKSIKRIDQFLQEDLFKVTMMRIEENGTLNEVRIEAESRLKALYNWVILMSNKLKVNYE